jgi:transcriptional regulator with XRE-family HTH domain
MAEVAVTNYCPYPAHFERKYEHDPKRHFHSLVGTAGVNSFDLFRQRFSGTNTLYICLTLQNELSHELHSADAKKLRIIKDSFKLSMVELAKIFEVSRQSLYDWLEGKTLSNDNSDKLEKFYFVFELLNDTGIELSPQVIRRNIDSTGSIANAISRNLDISTLAGKLKQALLIEAEQQQLLEKRLVQKSSSLKDVSAFAAPSYIEHG